MRGVLENRADEIMPPKVLSACLVPRKSLINVSYFFFHVADFNRIAHLQQRDEIIHRS